MNEKAKNLVCCSKPMEHYDSMFSNDYYQCMKCDTHATKFEDGHIEYEATWEEKGLQSELEL